MKSILPIVSYIALLGIIIPPILYLSDVLSKSGMSSFMLVGTLLWFLTVPFWMGRKANHS